MSVLTDIAGLSVAATMARARAFYNREKQFWVILHISNGKASGTARRRAPNWTGPERARPRGAGAGTRAPWLRTGRLAYKT